MAKVVKKTHDLSIKNSLLIKTGCFLTRGDFPLIHRSQNYSTVTDFAKLRG